MQIIIFEDEKVETLWPITLTRKASEIMIGGITLEKAVALVFGKNIEHKTWNREQNIEGWQAKSDKLYIKARAVPRIKSLLKIKALIKKGRKSGELELIDYPWEVVRWNEEILGENLLKVKSEKRKAKNKDVYFGKGVKAEKWVSFDTSQGPIIIGEGTVIKNFVHLEGPLYIGSGCLIREHTSLRGSSIGDASKIGGEVESSIIESYTNKQHSGFIGHSWIGSWINLGAGSSVSNLKNTYGQIRVVSEGKKIETGQQFLGCILGDWSKTAINTSILCGKIIGVSSHLYGIVSENVPSFTSWSQEKTKEFYLASALEVQRRMFLRRNKKQTKKDIWVLKRAYELTQEERRMAGVRDGRFEV